MKKVHFLSGLTLSVFIGIHLFNHFYSIFGADQHISMMKTLRVVYRNPIVETLLVTAVLVQIFSGVQLLVHARKKAFTAFEKIHIWSGIYLAFFLVIHVGAVFVGRLILNLDTNFYFGVAGINSFPFALFFVPYYSLGILAFFGHLAAIHRRKMNNSILGIRPSAQAVFILLVGVVVTFVIFYGVTNHFRGVELPESYKVLTGK